jgi:pyridoxal phosphate enzyme (YggS family)
VTKGRPLEDIQELYAAGCRVFGESRLQEALPKIAAMPKDCFWHMIGTLQKNKVRKAVESFHVLESVDTPELAYKISTVSLELDKTTPILLQVNVSGEQSKHGLDLSGWLNAYEDIRSLKGIRIDGLMTMAPFVENSSLIQACFKQLYCLREQLPGIGPHLSMGMSHDYKEAISAGATILRIGSLLFF